MKYRMPIYTLRIAFSDREMASCFGLSGVKDTIPRLASELYSVDLLGPYGIPWESVGTAAVHQSGAWTLNFTDGREYSGRVGDEVHFRIRCV